VQTIHRIIDFGIQDLRLEISQLVEFYNGVHYSSPHEIFLLFSSSHINNMHVHELTISNDHKMFPKWNRVLIEYLIVSRDRTVEAFDASGTVVSDGRRLFRASPQRSDYWWDPGWKERLQSVS
jgi:hypothetical protein